MKKSNYYLKEVVLALILSVFLLGCSSNDETDDQESNYKRTIITMATPVNSNINWNDVELVWNEEFEEAIKLDDNWLFETKDSFNPDMSEGLQQFQRKNVELSGGILKLYAKENAGVYTSARLSGKYAFKYGRIEIRTKLPEEEIRGIWAKMGLIGDNIGTVGWPLSGEMDIVEYFSNSPNTINNYIHSSTNNSENGTLISSNYSLETAEEEFHAYGILWTDKYIKFYLDNPDNITYSFPRPSSPNEENWPFDKPFYLIIGMVIGGPYGGEGVDASLFPTSLEIDYVRVYHPK